MIVLAVSFVLSFLDFSQIYLLSNKHDVKSILENIF